MTPTPKPWNVFQHFSPRALAKISPADRALFEDSLKALQDHVHQERLDHIPVFGFLSLRNSNFAELGKASQAEVRHGIDVVNASLQDHALDIIASTVLRGTPTRPGVTAGLRPKEGAVTRGVVVRVPVSEDPERLLARLLEREIESELDMRDTATGKSAASYSMPLMALTTDDGRKIKALVFMTNSDGPKALSSRDYFQDGLAEGGQLKPGAIAYMMAARGGFRRIEDPSSTGGGPCLAYWSNSYLSTQAKLGEPVDPFLRDATDRARLIPSSEILDDIAQRAWTEPEAREELEALLEIAHGAASPLAFRQEQRAADTLGLERTPIGTWPEATREERLSAAARFAKGGSTAEAWSGSTG